MRAGDIFIERRPEYAQRLGITPEQLSQLFGQNVNYVSDVVETQSDFQFYMIRDKLPAKMLKLDEEIQPGTAVTVYEYIRDNLTAQKRQQYFALTAMREVVDALRKPENFTLAKKEDEIKKLLSW
jgi:ribonuclease I